MENKQPEEKQQMTIDDTINNIMKEVVDGTIASGSFRMDHAKAWQMEIVNRCLESLAALEIPQKYIVTCIITKKSESLLVTATSNVWNADDDSGHTLHWENKTTICLLTVFCVSLF